MRGADFAVVFPDELLLVTGQSKVTDLDCPVIGEQDVLALEVTVEDLLGVQILDCEGHLLDDFEDLAVLKNHSASMGTRDGSSLTSMGRRSLSVAVKEVEDAALRAILGDHVVVVVFIEGHAHEEDDVRMSHLVHDLDFLDEVVDALLGCALAAKTLHSYGRCHPLRLEDLSIATSAQKISLIIELEIMKIDVETKAVVVEALDQIQVCILVKVFGIILVRVFLNIVQR